MKVIYAVNSDLGKHGTIGFRTYHVAKEAYEQGYLKSIICRGDLQNKIPKRYIKKVFPFYRHLNLGMSFISQYMVKKFPARKIQMNLFDSVVAQKLKTGSSKADILHIYEYSPRAMAQARKLGMKVVLDTQMAHGKTRDKIFKRKRNIGPDKSAKLADKIIASSKFVVKSYLDAGVSKEKMVLIPHGVDLKKFNFKRKDRKGKFTCLFVGIIGIRKGIDYLLEAWEKLNLPNAELVFCGRPDLSMNKALDKARKNKSIRFAGYTDPAPYYKSADVFIFPSLCESSAKVLYEAMASELPIITTFNSGPLFKDGEAGFIVPIRNSRAIAEKISYLKNHPSEALEMGRNGRKIVINHSWEDYGKSLGRLYKTMLKK